MHLLIPGALPPAAIARELADQLPQRAPVLHAWMRRFAAKIETVDRHETGCTPTEYWALRRAGFQPDAGQRLSAGLGPLRAGIQPEDECEPVWLADLVHLALGARHIGLIDPDALHITDDEEQALFDAVSPCLDDDIALTRLSPGRWRVHLPAQVTLPSASPAVISGGRLEDWWPHEQASRPWRQRLNEIQMIWHDHRVNVARAKQGQAPINSLWLYGGARPWSLACADPSSESVIIHTDLATPAATRNWTAWLTALATLDRDTLAPLAANRASPCITLAGEDRLVTLSPSRNLLPDWFPRRTQAWTSWWHPQV